MKNLIKRTIIFGVIFTLFAHVISPTVTNAASKKPYINQKYLTIGKGQSFKLKVKGTSKKVKWSSSNKSIATVSSSGIVKAKKGGNVTITAKMKKEKKLTCKIKVKTYDYLVDNYTPYTSSSYIEKKTHLVLSGEDYYHCLYYGCWGDTWEATYNIKGLYSKISFYVGELPDYDGPVTVILYGDGEEIGRFQKMEGSLSVKCTANIQNVRSLKIFVDQDTHNNCAALGDVKLMY